MRRTVNSEFRINIIGIYIEQLLDPYYSKQTINWFGNFLKAITVNFSNNLNKVNKKQNFINSIFIHFLNEFKNLNLNNKFKSAFKNKQEFEREINQYTNSIKLTFGQLKTVVLNYFRENFSMEYPIDQFYTHKGIAEKLGLIKIDNTKLINLTGEGLFFAIISELTVVENFNEQNLLKVLSNFFEISKGGVPTIEEKVENKLIHQKYLSKKKYKRPNLTLISKFLVNFCNLKDFEYEKFHSPSGLESQEKPRITKITSFTEIEKRSFKKDLIDFYHKKNKIFFVGISPKVNNENVIKNLEEIYIPLKASINETLFPKVHQKTKPIHHQLRISIIDQNHSEEEEIRDIHDIFEDECRNGPLKIIILGHPGQGKTTFVNYFTHSFIHQIDFKIKQLVSCFPIFFRASDLSDAVLNEPSISVLKYLTEKFPLSEKNEQFGSFIKQLADNNKLILIIDGLDEIPVRRKKENIELNLKEKTIKKIEEFMSLYPSVHYIITSRIVSYRERPLTSDIKRITLSVLNEKQIQEFVEKWNISINKKAEIKMSKESLSRKVNLMMESITSNTRIQKLAENPFLLTIICLMDYQGKQLPNRRIDLYEAIFETLVNYWPTISRNSEYFRREYVMIQKIFENIAFHIYEKYDDRRIHETKLEKLLIKIFKELEDIEDDNKAKKLGKNFIDKIEDDVGIFYSLGVDEQNNNIYGFLHRSLAEYLAGRYLSELWYKDKTVLNEYLMKPEWREVILLMSGHIMKTSQHWGTELFKQVINFDPGDENYLHRTKKLGLEILNDGALITTRVQREFLKNIIDIALNTKIEPLFEEILKLLIDQFKLISFDERFYEYVLNTKLSVYETKLNLMLFFCSSKKSIRYKAFLKFLSGIKSKNEYYIRIFQHLYDTEFEKEERLILYSKDKNSFRLSIKKKESEEFRKFLKSMEKSLKKQIEFGNFAKIFTINFNSDYNVLIFGKINSSDIHFDLIANLYSKLSENNSPIFKDAISLLRREIITDESVSKKVILELLEKIEENDYVNQLIITPKIVHFYESIFYQNEKLFEISEISTQLFKKTKQQGNLDAKLLLKYIIYKFGLIDDDNINQLLYDTLENPNSKEILLNLFMASSFEKYTSKYVDQFYNIYENTENMLLKSLICKLFLRIGHNDRRLEPETYFESMQYFNELDINSLNISNLEIIILENFRRFTFYELIYAFSLISNDNELNIWEKIHNQILSQEEFIFPWSQHLSSFISQNIDKFHKYIDHLLISMKNYSKIQLNNVYEIYSGYSMMIDNKHDKFGKSFIEAFIKYPPEKIPVIMIINYLPEIQLYRNQLFEILVKMVKEIPFSNIWEIQTIAFIFLILVKGLDLKPGEKTELNKRLVQMYENNNKNALIILYGINK